MAARSGDQLHLQRARIPSFTSECARQELASLCHERFLTGKEGDNRSIEDLRNMLRAQDVSVLMKSMEPADAEAELARVRQLAHSHRLDTWTHFFIAYFSANSVVTQSIAVAWYSGLRGDSEGKGYFLVITNSLAVLALCVFILGLHKRPRDVSCGRAPPRPSARAGVKVKLAPWPLTSVVMAPAPGLVIREPASTSMASAPRADSESGESARPPGPSNEEQLRAALSAAAAELELLRAQRDAAVAAAHRASGAPR